MENMRFQEDKGEIARRRWQRLTIGAPFTQIFLRPIEGCDVESEYDRCHRQQHLYLTGDGGHWAWPSWNLVTGSIFKLWPSRRSCTPAYGFWHRAHPHSCATIRTWQGRLGLMSFSGFSQDLDEKSGKKWINGGFRAYMFVCCLLWFCVGVQCFIFAFDVFQVVFFWVILLLTKYFSSKQGWCHQSIYPTPTEQTSDKWKGK